MGKMVKLGQFFVMALCVFVGVAIGSCGGIKNNDSEEKKLQVTVTIPPLRYFVAAIGGDSIEINSVLDESSDAETFQPGVSTFRDLANSQVLFTLGLLPFESAIETNVRENNGSTLISTVTEGMAFVYGTHSHAGEVDEADGEPDAHVWSSVKNAKVIAANVLQALKDASPTGSDYFTARYVRFAAELDSLDQAVEQRLSAIPSRNFAVWHPSLSYFARDYNLHQISFNVENKETSSVRLKHQIDEAKNEKPIAFIVPAGVGDSQINVIAENIGLKPVKINFMSADWGVEMEKVVTSLVGNN
jgi:zinc transport system substrate-binding protein